MPLSPQQKEIFVVFTNALDDPLIDRLFFIQGEGGAGQWHWK